MPRFVLDTTDLEYEFQPGQRLRVVRPTVRASISTDVGMQRPICIVDTGAPLSVVSWTVGGWLRSHARPVPVTNDPIPKYQNGILKDTTPQSALLSWDGSPCSLFTFDVSLTDTRTGVGSGPLEILAKWVQVPRPDIFNDQFILLGMHFFVANSCTLDLSAQPWGMSGGIGTP
jgi:hypothetical protein